MIRAVGLAYAMQHRKVNEQMRRGRTVSRQPEPPRGWTARTQQSGGRSRTHWPLIERDQLGAPASCECAAARRSLGKPHHAHDTVRSLQPHRASLRSSLSGGARAIIRRTSGLSDAALTLKVLSPEYAELVRSTPPLSMGCGQPSINRRHVLEPVSGRWSWVRVFDLL